MIEMVLLFVLLAAIPELWYFLNCSDYIQGLTALISWALVLVFAFELITGTAIATDRFVLYLFGPADIIALVIYKIAGLARRD